MGKEKKPGTSDHTKWQYVVIVSRVKNVYVVLQMVKMQYDFLWGSNAAWMNTLITYVSYHLWILEVWRRFEWVNQTESLKVGYKN